MSNKPNKTLLIKKKDLFKARFQNDAIAPLQPGEVLLRVDKYAFTTNNITYGVFGDRLYWAFFKGTDTEGIIPVWGFADVVVSNNPAIKVGERYYGYFPMSDLITVLPGHINSTGFSDIRSHRVSLPPIYNKHIRTANDPAYNVALEDYIPLLRPLFGTGFLNYHFLKEESFFKAKRIILTSASSKTALGLAFMLKQNQSKDKLKIVGLTSKKNVDFVKETGFYDTVISYEDYDVELKKGTSVVVDFSGNMALLVNLTSQLVTSLKFMSLIGFTDWQSTGAFKHPKAKMFFAPDSIQTLSKKWGAAKMNQRMGKALYQFINKAKNWTEVVPVTEYKDLKKLYLQVLKGDVDPSKGYIVRCR